MGFVSKTWATERMPLITVVTAGFSGWHSPRPCSDVCLPDVLDCGDDSILHSGCDPAENPSRPTSSQLDKVASSQPASKRASTIDWESSEIPSRIRVNSCSVSISAPLPVRAPVNSSPNVSRVILGDFRRGVHGDFVPLSLAVCWTKEKPPSMPLRQFYTPATGFRILDGVLDVFLGMPRSHFAISTAPRIGSTSSRWRFISSSPALRAIPRSPCAQWLLCSDLAFGPALPDAHDPVAILSRIGFATSPVAVTFFARFLPISIPGPSWETLPA